VSEDTKELGNKMKFKNFELKLDFDQTKIQSSSNAFNEHGHSQ